MAKHVVFDIGRVLLHFDPEIPFKRLIPDDEKRAWFMREVCSPSWNREQDRGRSWAEGEAILIEQHPGEADLIRAFRKNWHEMVPHTLEDTPQILAALVDAGHDVTMLTNFHQDTYPVAVERFAVLDRPRGVTVSGEVGILKPDRAIYDYHAKKFDLDPAEIIFFDDSQANVDGALAAGWGAHLFTDAQGMTRDLEAAGIRV